MTAMIDQKKPHDAECLFNSLVEEGHRPTLVTYTAMLKALGDQKSIDSVSSLLARVEEDGGLKPDAIFYNAVINAFVEAGKIGEAMEVFLKMNASGCRPTASTYNTLIKGYGIATKPEEAHRIFDMMSSGAGNPKPSQKTYNILIKAWCDRQKFDKVWDLMSKMKNSGVPPDVVTYNTVARAYAMSGETRRAEELVAEMPDNVCPNERTWAIVINGYCKEGSMSNALRCVRRMRDSGISLNVVVFNTLIKGFLDANDMDGVQEVARLMSEIGVEPDVITYSHQMNAWSALGLMSKCVEVLDKMIQSGVPPDSQVYGILAKGYVRARDPEKAEAVLGMMEQMRIRPNVVTFTTIISGWCSAGCMDDAMRVYAKMRRAGVRPNAKTFDTLMWGYGEVRQPWKCEELLQTMRDSGAVPTRNSYRLVAEAWRAVGLPDEAARVQGSVDDTEESPEDIAGLRPLSPSWSEYQRVSGAQAGGAVSTGLSMNRMAPGTAPGVVGTAALFGQTCCPPRTMSSLRCRKHARRRTCIPAAGAGYRMSFIV